MRPERRLQGRRRLAFGQTKGRFYGGVKAIAARARGHGGDIEGPLFRVRDRLPMAGDGTLKIKNLARVSEVQLREHNLLGVHLPTLEKVEIDITDYPALTTPHWLDHYQEALRDALALTVRLQVERERLRRLERAVKRVTQRVNLFDKVLIPRTRENIRRIRIHLADSERSAVVRAKLAKRKQIQGVHS